MSTDIQSQSPGPKDANTEQDLNADPEGAKIIQFRNGILQAIGKTQDATLSRRLERLRANKQIMAAQRFNRDPKPLEIPVRNPYANITNRRILVPASVARRRLDLATDDGAYQRYRGAVAAAAAAAGAGAGAGAGTGAGAAAGAFGMEQGGRQAGAGSEHMLEY